ncbi:hypothetical protein EV193_104363 [Herbihabitans rhizosphaerae]|uniref:Head-tail adaptor n=1 Tax=Herbihabitans rhizosphaerae TaxID=1872711 RepID=A0A4Q7KRP3_9PSEU|nr:hypothetical protein EV193_104363 [Herbihabitans rhizosphaerae]
MALFDSGATLDIYPSVRTVDADGNEVWLPSETPITVRGRVQPISSVEQLSFSQRAVIGQSVTTLYRVIARNAPGGPWSRVVYGGRDWEVVGEPECRRYSSATSHVTAIIRAKGVPSGAG